MLAPTGTIAFMMDCDTTGVEPDIALVKYKKLVGGGMLKIVNRTVPMALAQARLHRAADRERSSTTSTSTRRSRTRRPCAPSTSRCSTARSAPVNGTRVDPLDGPRPHDGRGAAVPVRRDQQDREPARADATVDDIEARLHRGLAPRAEGARRVPRRQQAHAAAQRGQGRAKGAKVAHRRGAPRGPPKLPDERRSLTHKFSIAGHEGYLTVGLYDDGSRARSSSSMAKEGSTVSGPHGHDRDDDVDRAPVRRPARRRSSTSSATRASSRRASRTTARSRSPSRSWTTCSAGSVTASSRKPALADEQDAGPEDGRPRRDRGGSGTALGRDRARRTRIREPRGRARLQRVRLDHGTQRRLLQVPELRRDERLLLS